MKKWLPLFLLLATVQVSAQQTKPRFETRLQAGLLEGEAGSAFQLQAVGALRYQSWSAGIGGGLDYYHSRSLPLFLELRKSFGAVQKGPFVYASSGYNFPWLRPAEKDWSLQKARGGLYLDAGLGYHFALGKQSKLYFSVGYSQKEYETTSAYSVAIGVYPPIPATFYTADYTLRRLSIKMGLGF